MFNRIATFNVLPPRRPVPGLNAPANDNRRNACTGASWRAHAPRLVCRWSLSPDTGRPVCHWELDHADEPSPRSRNASGPGQAFHKTVFQPSYQDQADKVLRVMAIVFPHRMP